jgi:hypothetical protein
MQKKSVDYVSRQLPLQGLDLDSEYHSQESTQSEKLGQKPIDVSTQGIINQSIGQAGEDLVRYILHRWRYNIFEPTNPSSKCDFVINKDNKWVTIQVKATEKSDRIILKREKGDKYRAKSVKYPYTSDDFNLLFVAKFPLIYIIPFEAIRGNSISLDYYENYVYDLNDPETYNNPPKL